MKKVNHWTHTAEQVWWVGIDGRELVALEKMDASHRLKLHEFRQLNSQNYILTECIQV
jgi:hypothetical protein